MNEALNLLTNPVFWCGVIAGVCVVLAIVAQAWLRRDQISQQILLNAAQAHYGVRLGGSFYYLITADQYIRHGVFVDSMHCREPQQ